MCSYTLNKAYPNVPRRLILFSHRVAFYIIPKHFKFSYIILKHQSDSSLRTVFLVPFAKLAAPFAFYYL